MIPIRDTIQARNVPLVTWAIILLNGLVFFLELTIPPEHVQVLVRRLGMIPARLGSDPQAYTTLITSMFLHGGWLHFLGNMWVLYIFGDNVEDRMGPARYLIFYLLCGIVAGLTHYAADPESVVPTVGASGAIAGVLGAYLFLFPTSRIITLVPLFFIPLFFEIPAVVYLGIWFLTQVMSGSASLINGQPVEGVAWWAHIGGFVTGIVLLPFFKQSRQNYRPNYPDEYQPW
jgi:membrane associated rhomboid family serine protease